MVFRIKVTVVGGEPVEVQVRVERVDPATKSKEVILGGAKSRFFIYWWHKKETPMWRTTCM